MLNTYKYYCGNNLLNTKALEAKSVNYAPDFSRVSTNSTSLVELVELVETQKCYQYFSGYV